MVSPKINIPPRTDVAKPRKMLTDQTWEFLNETFRETGRVYNKYEHRMTLEGILYRLRTGTQWQDLPEEFALWNTVFKCFNLWSRKVFWKMCFSNWHQVMTPNGCSLTAVLLKHIKTVVEPVAHLMKP